MLSVRFLPLLPMLLLSILSRASSRISSRHAEIQHCVSFNLTAEQPGTAAPGPPRLPRLLRLTQSTSRCNGCNFGDLPGMWDPFARTGEKWQTFSRECSLVNMVEKYRLPCSLGANPKPKVLLLLGDSIDREMIAAVAQTYNLTEHICEGNPGWDMNRVHAIHVNPKCGGPVIGRIHLYGSSPVGPWDQGVQENYETILKDKVPGVWRGKLGLPDPDMIVINCNLWDIARTSQLSKHGLSLVFEQPVLPREFVDSWLVNSTQLVKFVQGMFPSAVIGWHSVVIGKHDAADGVMNSRQLGKKSFVEQLNAAGRELASELGLLMLDYEALQTRFHDFSYLKDNHHQSSEVSMEAANIYFNLLEQLPSLPYDYHSCQAA